MCPDFLDTKTSAQTRKAGKKKTPSINTKIWFWQGIKCQSPQNIGNPTPGPQLKTSPIPAPINPTQPWTPVVGCDTYYSPPEATTRRTSPRVGREWISHGKSPGVVSLYFLLIDVMKIYETCAWKKKQVVKKSKKMRIMQYIVWDAES